jgi:hypothetical protein
LETTSANWQISNVHFNVIFEDMCGSGAYITNDYLSDRTYLVNDPWTAYTIHNFSISGVIDSNNCFIDDSVFSLSVSPSTSIIYLYKSIYVAVKTSSYSDVGNYTVTVTEPLTINNYSVSSSFVI